MVLLVFLASGALWDSMDAGDTVLSTRGYALALYSTEQGRSHC
jgi:hypothetical protein